MFINIIQFPPVIPGRDADFRNWFAWSNAEYAKQRGFISRKLLNPRKGGAYSAIVEHDTYETFMAMHTSPTQAEARRRVAPFLEGDPTPHFYEIVVR